MEKKRLAIVSGGFDPVHIGHLEFFERAKSMADDLFVIVNNDEYLKRKKGKPFMPFKERMIITNYQYICFTNQFFKVSKPFPVREMV